MNLDNITLNEKVSHKKTDIIYVIYMKRPEWATHTADYWLLRVWAAQGRGGGKRGVALMGVGFHLGIMAVS
jgi:hypothetical protein